MLDICAAMAVDIGEHGAEVGVFLAALQAGDAVVAAQGDGRDAVARAIVLKAYVGARHADHELGHAHAKALGGDEVAQLVDHHQEDEDDKTPKHCEQGINQGKLPSLRQQRSTSYLAPVT